MKVRFLGADDKPIDLKICAITYSTAELDKDYFNKVSGKVDPLSKFSKAHIAHLSSMPGYFHKVIDAETSKEISL